MLPIAARAGHSKPPAGPVQRLGTSSNAGGGAFRFKGSEIDASSSAKGTAVLLGLPEADDFIRGIFGEFYAEMSGQRQRKSSCLGRVPTVAPQDQDQTRRRLNLLLLLLLHPRLRATRPRADVRGERGRTTDLVMGWT